MQVQCEWGIWTMYELWRTSPAPSISSAMYVALATRRSAGNRGQLCGNGACRMVDISRVAAPSTRCPESTGRSCASKPSFGGLSCWLRSAAISRQRCWARRCRCSVGSTLWGQHRDWCASRRIMLPTSESRAIEDAFSGCDANAVAMQLNNSTPSADTNGEVGSNGRAEGASHIVELLFRSALSVRSNVAAVTANASPALSMLDCFATSLAASRAKARSAAGNMVCHVVLSDAGLADASADGATGHRRAHR